MASVKRRRTYDEKFKKQAVRNLLKSGKGVSSFAASAGMNRSNLQKWKKIYGPEFTSTRGRADGKFVGFDDFISLKKEVTLLNDAVDNLRTVIKKNLENKYSDG